MKIVRRLRFRLKWMVRHGAFFSRMRGVRLLFAALSIAAAAVAANVYLALIESIPTSPTEEMALVSGGFSHAPDEFDARTLGGQPVHGRNIPKGRRILCFGDSFCLSFGVPDSHTFPVFLQKELNGGRLVGPYGVDNFGLNAAGLKTVLDRYRRLAGRIDHSVVILVYGFGDILDTYAETSREPAAGRFASAPILKKTALGRKIRTAAIVSRQKTIGEMDLEAVRAVYEEVFSLLVEEVRAQGARSVLVMIDHSSAQRQIVRDLAERAGVLYYQQEFSLGLNGEYRLPDGHFNARGNARLARETALFLMKNGLVR